MNDNFLEFLQDAVFEAYMEKLKIAMTQTAYGELDIPSRDDIALIISVVTPLILAAENNTKE